MEFQEAIKRLRSTVEFQIVMKEADKHRPFLLPFDPGSKTDQQNKWIYDSGRQNGFEMLFQFLEGK